MTINKYDSNLSVKLLKLQQKAQKPVYTVKFSFNLTIFFGMLVPESFQSTINCIAANALALSYTQDEELEILNKIYIIDSSIEVRNSIMYWGRNFSGEDLDRLDDKGITRDQIEKIVDISNSLYNLSCLPIGENELTNMYKEMGPLYYNFKMDEFKKYINELEQLYDECKSPLKNKENIIERDFRGLGQPRDILHILNPYKLIKDGVPKLRKLIKKSRNIVNIQCNFLNFQINSNFYQHSCKIFKIKD